MKFSTVTLCSLSVCLMLSGCSVAKKAGKSARNLTKFGSQSGDLPAPDANLIVPPTLKIPNDVIQSRAAAQPRVTTPQTSTASANAPTAKKTSGNYFVVVGTYPDQLQALEIFSRLSSIGLEKATMESRQTRQGKLLHMVRLGPFTNQTDIDKAKDRLLNGGMANFKVVQN